MIILVVADLHYDLRKFDWVTGLAEAADVVVIAGDHMEIASTVARPTQSILIQKYFQRISEKASLIVSSGNHDLDFKDPNGEMATRWIKQAHRLNVPTDEDTIEIGNVRFTVCPWIDGAEQRAAQTLRFRDTAQDRPATWIWVYHSPPDHSATSVGRGRSWGDPWLSEWIEAYSPDIVLAGHVHEAPFAPDGSWVDRVGGTFVFNAGHQHGPYPSFVLIDTEKRLATWHSLAGTQQIRLGTDVDGAEAHAVSFLDLPESIVRAAQRLEH